MTKLHPLVIVIDMTYTYGEALEPMDYRRDYVVTFVCPKCQKDWSKLIFEPVAKELQEWCECGLMVIGLKDDVSMSVDYRIDDYVGLGFYDEESCEFIPANYSAWLEKNLVID